MKTTYKIVLISGLIIGIASSANAYIDNTNRSEKTEGINTVYTYKPVGSTFGFVRGNESRTYNQGRNKHYTWGMEHGIDLDAVSITSASITFDGIHRWNDNKYSLFVHLLDNPEGGIQEFFDHSNRTNALAGKGVGLKHYTHNGNGINRNNRSNSDRFADGLKSIVYDFSAREIDYLADYASDGIIGLGFDPDCLFWNEGVSFSITTQPNSSEPVPEPATMLLFGTGLIGLAIGVRKRKAK